MTKHEPFLKQLKFGIFVINYRKGDWFQIILALVILHNMLNQEWNAAIVFTLLILWNEIRNILKYLETMSIEGKRET